MKKRQSQGQEFQSLTALKPEILPGESRKHPFPPLVPWACLPQSNPQFILLHGTITGNGSPTFEPCPELEFKF